MSSDDSDNNNSDNNSSENEDNSQNDSINVTGTQTTDYLYALFTNPSLLISFSIKKL